MAINNLPAIQRELENPGIVARINTRLGDKAGTFITSVLDLCGEDQALAECDPKLVIKESLKAAGLDLPINKNLGFAYVIPYKKIPSFQMGWKGYVQLAIRTGKYRHLNTGIVYEGEEMIVDRIRGTLEIGGKRTGDNPIGYYCYMELLNGFQKAIAWTKEKVEEHAKRFSKSYSYYLDKKRGRKPVWVTDFDAMALKTMFLQLVPKYGPMTIEMSQAIAGDRSDFKGFDNQVSEEIQDNANEEIIDIPKNGDVVDADFYDGQALTDAEKAEIEHEEANAAMAEPGF
jgi:recombination protein RecT